jgi:ketosteroid isomerase-like protein
VREALGATIALSRVESRAITSQLAREWREPCRSPRIAPRRLRDTHRVMPEESTTPDLMELQKRLTDAANRRDLDAMMAFYAPVGVYDMSPVGMGVFEGQAAARGFIEDWWGSYAESEFEAEETLDLGSGVGFRVIIQKGRPVGSSGEVELRYAAVSVWEDGKIVRMTNYNDIDAARAIAVRLAEERE